MSKRPTSSALAIKDMRAENVRILFEGEINEIHDLNAMIGIETRTNFKRAPKATKIEVKVEVKVEVHPAYNWIPREATTPAPTNRICFRGGVQCLFDDWDND